MRSVLSLGRSLSLSPGSRFSVFYWALFLQIGIALPFWPIVLASRGLTPAQLGIVLAAAPASRMIGGPLFGFLSDRYGLWRGFLALLACGAALGYSGFGMLNSFWPILVLTLVQAPLYASIAPIVDSHAISTAEEKGLDFGRMRLWGSIGFIVANLLGGALIKGAPPDMILALIIAATLLGALAAPCLPPLREASAHVARPDWGMAGALLKSRPFVTVALTAGSIQATHALLYGFGTLGWRAQGISETAIGLLWAVGVLAEVVFLSQSRWFLQRLGPSGLLVLSGIACMIRWGAMAFTPSFGFLFAFQLLHGFTFAATYVGGIHLVQQIAPRNLVATAQALYAAMSAGILFALASAISGALFGQYGSLAYIVPAAVGGVGAFAAYALFQSGRKPDAEVSPIAEAQPEP